MHSLRRGCEHVPALLLFYECQKIILSFDLKLQRCLLLCLQNTSHGLRGFYGLHLIRVTPCDPWPGSSQLLFVFDVHVLGVDHAFVLLSLAIAAGRAVCRRFSAWARRPRMGRLALRGFLPLLGPLVRGLSH